MVLTNYMILNTSSTLGRYPAYKITHEKWFKPLKAAISQKLTCAKYFEVGTIVDGIVYNLRVRCNSFEDQNKYSDAIMKIINSFEFIQ